MEKKVFAFDSRSWRKSFHTRDQAEDRIEKAKKYMTKNFGSSLVTWCT
jgi:hypothetical protein